MNNNYDKIRKYLNDLISFYKLNPSDEGNSFINNSFIIDVSSKKIWSVKQAQAIYNILEKHLKSLNSLGYSTKFLVPPILKVIEEDGEDVDVFFCDGDEIIFKGVFGYDEEIGKINGKKYEKNEGIYKIPQSSIFEVVEVCLKKEYSIKKCIYNLLLDKIEIAEMSFTKENTLLPIIPNLKRQPMDFQRVGIEYASKIKKTFIGDQMGLGKTIQAIITLEVTNSYPALIVCPASLKYNWLKEIEATLNNKIVYVLEDMKSFKPADIYITNYDNLKKYTNYEINKKITKKVKDKASDEIEKIKELLDKVDDEKVKQKLTKQIEEKKKKVVNQVHTIGYESRFDVDMAHYIKGIVFDESHYLKEMETTRTQLAKRYAQDKDLVLLLTGTPILNKPTEMIAQLDVMGKLDDFGGKNGFGVSYCNMKLVKKPFKTKDGKYTKKYVYEVAEPRNDYERKEYNEALKRLNVKLRGTCFLRRLKKDVLPQLPTLTRQIIPVSLSNYDEYVQVESDLISYLREYRDYEEERLKGIEKTKSMVKVEYLKQVAAKGKISFIKEFIYDVIDNGEKVIVFAHHKEIINELKGEFTDALVISGEDDVSDRQLAVDTFQNDKSKKIIICSLKAASVGLTLTESSKVIFTELGWTPAEHDQAEARSLRIGQKSSVNAYYFIGIDTIEEKIMSLLDKKRSVSDDATGTVEMIKINIIDDVLEYMKNRKTIVH